MKNLLVVDLESTCYEKGKEPSGFFSEIIEIGAVVLDAKTGNILEEFQCFVKPVLFPQLSPFCKELTTITQEQVNAGISAEEAMSQIHELFKRHDCVFSSWGFYDEKQFRSVCSKFSIRYPFSEDHISLKHEHKKFYKLSRPMGMGTALKHHKMPLIGVHHRGIDDAKNIARIATHMVKDGWTHRHLTK